MSELFNRPEIQAIKDAYNHLFNSNLSISKIKDAASGGRLFRASTLEDAGIAGRSMAWKLFLLQAEPLKMPSEVTATAPLDGLRASRKEFTKLLLDKMRAPDGKYEEGLVIPGLPTSPPRVDQSTIDLAKNNPLSLDAENPWTKWFASVDLRKTILQDVERTFPDIAYFRDPDVQAQLTNILFIHSTLHPDIGYRQGMHELLAMLYFAVDLDSVSAPLSNAALDPALEELCSREWVAADAWALFASVMRGVGRCYEWREPEGSTDAAGSNSLKPYVSPIVEACNRIQSTCLKVADPELWRKLQSAGIEPQIYGIRWLRLLFTREFNMEDSMLIWDGLFAIDPTFDLAEWICVAMLIRIRNQLIPGDYSAQLTSLLRYPPPPVTSEIPPIHHAILLLHQAETLQMSPSPTTGVAIIHENRNMLGIPVEVPEPPPPPMRRRAATGAGGRGQSFSSDHSRLDPSTAGPSRGPGHARLPSTPLALPEMFARNLLERGESLGINKAVMNAVSDLKRNLPDLANLPRLPLSPPAHLASYPLLDDRSPTERPSWESSSRFETERELTRLRSVQKRLGSSVLWILETLEHDEDNTNVERVNEVKERKQDALQCLAYVGDILNGTITDVDEERLMSKEDRKRRRAEGRTKASSESSPVSHPAPSSTPSLPRPISAAATEPLLQSSSSSRLETRPSIPIARLPSPQAPPMAPSPTVLSPNNKDVPLAPWSGARSGFASREPPMTSFSRPPHRTSSSANRLSPATMRAQASPPPSGLPQQRAGPPPPIAASKETPPRQGVQHDPLGALR